MVTTNFFLDQRKGEAPFQLKLRLTYKRQSAYMMLGVKLMPEQWDGVKVVRHPRVGMVNTQILGIKADVDSRLFELRCAGRLEGLKVSEIKGLLEAQDRAGFEDDEENEDLKVTFGLHFRSYLARKTGSTATTYRFTYNTLAEYANVDCMRFEEVTPSWLERFGEFCRKKGHGDSTVGLHYRYIRAVFNDAITEELTSAYPFRKFKIKKPAEKPVKVLTVEELREFWNYPVDESLERFRDAFKLIFLLRGINLKDLCHLTRKNIRNGRLYYNRAKTKKPYSIKIEPEIQELLDKYEGEKYLLDYLERNSSHQNFNWRLIDKLRMVGETKIGKQGKKIIRPLQPDISPYYARRSFATIGHYDCGVPMDVISDLLGHSNGLAVTNIYIRKNEKVADEAARKIIDFVLYGK